MRKKLNDEIQNIRQEQFWNRVMGNSQSVGFIHEISNWDIIKIDGSITHVKIGFNWTSFDLEYLGNPVYEEDYVFGPRYVVCARFGTGPSGGYEHDILLISGKMHDYPILYRKESQGETSKEATSDVLEFLDPEMEPIDLLTSLYHLLLLEPYPCCEKSADDYDLTIEHEMDKSLWLKVKAFNFLDD